MIRLHSLYGIAPEHIGKVVKLSDLFFSETKLSSTFGFVDSHGTHGKMVQVPPEAVLKLTSRSANVIFAIYLGMEDKSHCFKFGSCTYQPYYKLNKACQCGALHTEFPDLHSRWCELHPDHKDEDLEPITFED